MTNKYDSYTDEQLDREVAERVCGWDYHTMIRKHWRIFPESMDACLEHVIPAMRERGLLSTILDKTIWSVEFLITKDSGCRSIDKSLPRAICISALLALDAMDNETNKD